MKKKIYCFEIPPPAYGWHNMENLQIFPIVATSLNEAIEKAKKVQLLDGKIEYIGNIPYNTYINLINENNNN